MPPVEILEITPVLLPQVCEFLAVEVGRGITAAEFSAAFGQRWSPGPSGYALVSGERVVGALATIRSARSIRGRLRHVCNLSSWAVAPSFRTYAPTLLQRAIAEPDTIVTNFTASAAVAGILRAFRFVEMPPEERVLLPLPGPATRTATWNVDEDRIEAMLRARGHDEAATCVHDHHGTRTKWVIVDFGSRCCAFALHLMRVRRIPFAYVVYCSAPELFAESVRVLRKACVQTWGWHLIAWPRARLGTVAGTIAVRRPQPVLFRGEDVAPADLDGLYSELTLLPILR